MTREALAAVEAELRGPVPGLDDLTDADLQRLAAQIRAARQQQEQGLKQAFEDTLAHLPALLRGPVRKLFQKG